LTKATPERTGANAPAKVLSNSAGVPQLLFSSAAGEYRGLRNTATWLYSSP
jgi:hypothetical protein